MTKQPRLLRHNSPKQHQHSQHRQRRLPHQCGLPKLLAFKHAQPKPPRLGAERRSADCSQDGPLHFSQQSLSSPPHQMSITLPTPQAGCSTTAAQQDLSWWCLPQHPFISKLLPLRQMTPLLTATKQRHGSIRANLHQLKAIMRLDPLASSPTLLTATPIRERQVRALIHHSRLLLSATVCPLRAPQAVTADVQMPKLLPGPVSPQVLAHQ